MSVCPNSADADRMREQSQWDSLNPDLEWMIGEIEITGASHFSTGSLDKKMLSSERPWYKPWRARPEFDPAIFERDIARLVRFYESEGFYKALISYEWNQEEGGDRILIDLTISIVEGPRATVATVDLEVIETLDTPPQSLDVSGPFSLKTGTPFREDDYRATAEEIERIYLSEGFPWVAIERSARVNTDRTQVIAAFRAKPGLYATIASIEIAGVELVSPELISRELTFALGEPFSIQAIEASRSKLLSLGLFASVSIDWSEDGDQLGATSVRITVKERPHREIRIGVGYSTEEEAQVSVRWGDDNWFGSGRRTAFTGRYSSVVRSLDYSFMQPHMWEKNDRGLLNISVFQETERMYTRNSVRARPAFERKFSIPLVLNVGLQLETTRVRDVDSELSQLIGGVRSEGILIGPTLSLEWSPVDSLIHPTTGWVAKLQVEASTTLLGATYDYYKTTASITRYHPLGKWGVLAARLEIGVADSFSAPDRLPIFERLYAGGENSVRGYQRRQLGPRASNGDPLGGRSRVEGAVEARIPVWRDLGVVGFVDFGQVSLDRFDLVPDDLRYSAGPGLIYDTPFGPLSLYAGFPLNGKSIDPSWQLHFSIGFFF
jgi:outer membrane protein assembly complex protein YaeT